MKLELLHNGSSCIIKTVSSGPWLDHRSRQTYQVHFYPDGPDSDAVYGYATQLQGTQQDTIPVDSWGIAVKANDQWYMQFPVLL